MQSKAATVDDYLLEVPEERLPALTRLRALCLELLPDYEEAMTYGMPAYSRGGVVEVAFNSQKNYISLYGLKASVVDDFRERLKGLSAGKGCIRYSKPNKIDFEVVADLLRAIRESEEPAC